MPSRRASSRGPGALGCAGGEVSWRVVRRARGGAGEQGRARGLREGAQAGRPAARSRQEARPPSTLRWGSEPSCPRLFRRLDPEGTEKMAG